MVCCLQRDSETLRFEPHADTVIKKSTNKRFTMRDIGAIEKRLSNVEYYTSLNLLESDTFNTQITDASGKNRFKWICC